MKNFLVFIAIAAAFLLIACDDSTNNPKDDGTLTDIDGNVYKTVKIGNQIWMAENLNVTHYRNGDTIPEVTDPDELANLTTGAWSYYDNTPANGDIYGKLYNWYAVNDPRGLAPKGWHVPSDDEWKELEMCLGMNQNDANNEGYRGTNQASQLAGRTDLWNNGVLKNNSMFGSSKFIALPGGWHSYNGSFFKLGSNGNWWASLENSETLAWFRGMSYLESNLYRYITNKADGLSVRCVKDK